MAKMVVGGSLTPHDVTYVGRNCNAMASTSAGK